MAFTYGFYDSLSGDRKYNAEQFTSIFDGIIQDGVFESIGEKFQVKAKSTPSMKILVGSGRAWFNHTWTLNTADEELTIGSPAVLFTRRDAVVLEVNFTQGVRANSFKVIPGAEDSSSTLPTLTHSGGVYQHLLAIVTVAPGTTAIEQSMITNYIGMDQTPYTDADVNKAVKSPYVTGILQTTTVDELVAQWNGEFNEWFDSLNIVLSGDVATKLGAAVTISTETIDLYTGLGWTDPGPIGGTGSI